MEESEVRPANGNSYVLMRLVHLSGGLMIVVFGLSLLWHSQAYRADLQNGSTGASARLYGALILGPLFALTGFFRLWWVWTGREDS